MASATQRKSSHAGGRAVATDLGSCVRELVNTLARGSAQIAAEDNLTHVDYAVLKLFLEVEEWTTTLMASVLPLAPSTISRTVAKLVDRGLIQRLRLRTDRRVVILTLTEQGMAVTRGLHDRVQAHEARLCRGVSDQEMAALVSLTSTVVSNFAAPGGIEASAAGGSSGPDAAMPTEGL